MRAMTAASLSVALGSTTSIAMGTKRKTSCIAFYSATLRKGGFDATSLASVVKGGKESGAGITWGDASKSSLYKTSELGISSPDDDLAMPPKKAKERHPLTKEQLEKVKAFIESNK